MYKNNEEDRLKKYIHSLKSASGNIGAVNLSKYAIKMEEKICKKVDVVEELNDIVREFKVIEENILK